LNILLQITKSNELAPSLIAKIRKIEDLDLTEERKQLSTSRENEEVFERELKKFFVLQVINPGSYVVPGPVDQLWHAFLSDAEKVSQFEDQIGMKIEHRPNNPADLWEQMLGNTKSEYKRYFGAVPEELYQDKGMLCWGCGSDD